MAYAAFAKASLNDAIDRALNLSFEHPEITYYVVDKKRNRSRVLSVWPIVRDLVAFQRWNIVCTVTSGNIKY